MEETMMNFLKQMYAEMQEDNKQIKNKLDVLENAIAEIKNQMGENAIGFKKELETVHNEILEIKYNE